MSDNDVLVTATNTETAPEARITFDSRSEVIDFFALLFWNRMGQRGTPPRSFIREVKNNYIRTPWNELKQAAEQIVNRDPVPGTHENP